MRAHVWKSTARPHSEAPLPSRRLRLNCPPEDPSAGMWTRTHWSCAGPERAEHSLGIRGIPRAGWVEQLPAPGPQGARASRNMVTRLLELGGISCWPLLRGAGFTHLELAQVSLHSPRSPRDCKAGAALAKGSCAVGAV